jgi:hypothetical protein
MSKPNMAGKATDDEGGLHDDGRLNDSGRLNDCGSKLGNCGGLDDCVRMSDSGRLSDGDRLNDSVRVGDWRSVVINGTCEHDRVINTALNTGDGRCRGARGGG